MANIEGYIKGLYERRTKSRNYICKRIGKKRIALRLFNLIKFSFLLFSSFSTSFTSIGTIGKATESNPNRVSQTRAIGKYPQICLFPYVWLCIALVSSVEWHWRSVLTRADLGLSCFFFLFFFWNIIHFVIHAHAFSPFYHEEKVINSK